MLTQQEPRKSSTVTRRSLPLAGGGGGGRVVWGRDYCSPASRYGFIMVCLIYLLLLAGDIELNPGPVPGECAPSPERTCKPKDRFMADVLSTKTELLSMSFNNLIRVYGTTARTIKT